MLIQVWFDRSGFCVPWLSCWFSFGSATRDTRPATSRRAGQEVKPLESQPRDKIQQAENSVFSTPRERVRLLILVNRFLAENDIAEPVTLLGRVLTETATEDDLFPVQGALDQLKTMGAIDAGKPAKAVGGAESLETNVC